MSEPDGDDARPGAHRGVTGHAVIAPSTCAIGPRQAGIQGEVKVVARHWRGALQHAQYAPLCGRLNVLYADLAVQYILVGLLDANLADVRGPAVIGTVDFLQGLLVDATHVTEDMNPEPAERIVA